MKKYSSYKDSGVEWIGKIPEHWNFTSIKNLVSIKVTDGPHETPTFLDYGIPFLSAESVFEGKLDFDKKRGYISLEQHLLYSKKCKPINDDIFIVKSGSTTGKSAIVETDIDFNIWSPLCIIRSEKSKIIPKFTFYSIQSVYFRQFIELGWSFGTQPNIGMGVIENIRLIVPSVEEQQQIVNFLDTKTQKLDQLIEQKQKKIELLKEKRIAIINHTISKGLDKNVELKDSGVEWIGKIPKDWKVVKIKHISTIISKGTTPSTIGREILDFGEVRYLKSENIVDNKVVENPMFYIDNITNDKLERSKLYHNDILFVIAGASIGKVAILQKDFCPANTNQAVSFIRLKENQNHLFVWYWLTSSKINEQIWLDAVQSAQPNLSMEDLGNFYIPFPEFIEQQKIVEYLDKQTNEIDTLIELEKNKIEKLKEYKQSLISEVVTGKIRVCEHNYSTELQNV